MRELVTKNALEESSLPNVLSDWVSVHSSLCVYTTMQTTKFPESHLQAGGWYLDCSGGFVPPEEKNLLASLVSTAPEDNVIAIDEPDIEELPPPKAPKAKGRAKKSTTQASSQVVTRSTPKTPVDPPTDLTTVVGGSPSSGPSLLPSSTPSAIGPLSLATPSHSGARLFSLPRKRKAALPDTSTT